MKLNHILSELNINEADILNVYPYGSRVYGTQREDSDYDFIIVYKSSMLPDGSFRSNAISSQDKNVQAICYGRGGFIDSINNYYMPALESLSTMPLKKKLSFQMSKYYEKEMIKKVITQASNSWFLADKLWEIHEAPGMMDRMKKGIWHSIRILKFGLQIKGHQEIVDFQAANEDLETFMTDEDFSPRKYLEFRDSLMLEFKK